MARMCPNCSSKLRAADLLQPYRPMRGSQPTPLFMIAFLIIIGSGFVNALTPEYLRNYVLVLYYITGAAYLYKVHVTRLPNTVFECDSCHKAFRGQYLEPFSYRDWSESEYNNSLKRDSRPDGPPAA